MRLRYFSHISLGAAALLLAACATGPEEEVAAAPEPEVVEAEPEPVVVDEGPTATPGLAPRERLQLAIQQLETGQSEQAAVELEAYIAEVPNSAQAMRLLSHIQSPIEDLYPAEYFTVELMEGETLSNLANIYLGDLLNFYVLARYNEITNPQLVSVGQAIRIPSTPETLAAHEERQNPTAATASAGTPAPAPVASGAPGDPWNSVRAHVAAGRFGEAITEAEDSRLTPNAEQAAVLARAYDGNARAIRGSNADQAAAHALRAGELYLRTANRPEAAIASLELATELAPDNAEAGTMLASARTQTVDMYYRNGVAAFQRQDLDGAISAYDRVLELDPAHQNAQVNRLQAIQLRENLQRLNR